MSLQSAAIVLLLLPAQAGGGSATMDLTTFVAEVERARAIVGDAATLEQGRAGASDLADRWRVEIDGEIVSVDASWIDAELRAADAQSWTSVRDRITRRLTAIRMDAAEPTFEHVRDPKAVLTETLARAEFQRSPSSTWLDELRERFGRWLLGIMNRVWGTAADSRTAALTFAWVASGVALAALSLWFVTMLARRSRPAPLDLGPTGPKRTPAREWALRAMAAAQSGDLREAVRCGYHAALHRLEEQGLWTIDESRTPREYVRLLAADDQRYGSLTDLTRRFEQVCYGHRTATGDDARQVAVHLESLGCVRPADRAI